MTHHVIALDFETYYDDQYSLRKMSIPEYILDPRYETIMCAVQVDDGPHLIIEGDDVGRWFSQFDPAKTSTVAFNALFDNSILSWLYGFVPARMHDTMGMARALIGHKLRKGASLKAVAETLCLPAKSDVISHVKGMRTDQIKEAGIWDAFCGYAKLDNQLNHAIFYKLLSDFPPAERRLADLVLRCAVVPRFQLDRNMILDHLEELRHAKAELLTKAGTTVADLMSTARFKEALEALGVVVETKTSSSTYKQIPALAKTDKFMAELAEHEDIRVQALAAARLGHKSTIEETRAQKLLDVADAFYRHGNVPLIPIPLAYGKAHTHRLAGDWGMNMQNLPSSRSGKSKLRKALIAPPGHTVITCDLGQIEARLSAWFCGCHSLLEQFATGTDPYAIMGSKIFGYEVDPKVHKTERFIGKTAILGLGYGCGQDRFFDMVIKLARTLKIDLSGVWTDQLAAISVNRYRQTYAAMPLAWNVLDKAIGYTWMGKCGVLKLGPNDVVEVGHGSVKLPNDMYLRYDNPRIEDGEFTYDHGRGTHRLYGAKLLENIIQALARIVVMNAALRILGHGFADWARFTLQAHDELVFIVPDDQVKHAKKIIHEEMVRRPSWAPDLPLTAEIGVGQSYGEAK